MEKKELSINEYSDREIDMTEVCGGCKHFRINLDDCREKNIPVRYETPKCDKWRYFA